LRTLAERCQTDQDRLSGGSGGPSRKESLAVATKPLVQSIWGERMSPSRRQFLGHLGLAACGLIAPRFGLAAETTAPAVLSGFDANGRHFTLDDFPGKVCLVSFFRSGCNLCSHDLKLMREFYQGNRSRGFVLVAVSLDESEIDYRNYAAILSETVAQDERFPIVWRRAKGHVDSFGKITAQPTHFVLNRSHQVAKERDGPFGPEDWDDLWASIS
jgi:peroxiredoxin